MEYDRLLKFPNTSQTSHPQDAPFPRVKLPLCYPFSDCKIKKDTANVKAPAFTNLRRKGVSRLTVSASLKPGRVGHGCYLTWGTRKDSAGRHLPGALRTGLLGSPLSCGSHVRPGCKDFNSLLQTPSLTGGLLIDSSCKIQYHAG